MYKDLIIDLKQDDKTIKMEIKQQDDKIKNIHPNNNVLIEEFDGLYIKSFRKPGIFCVPHSDKNKYTLHLRGTEYHKDNFIVTHTFKSTKQASLFIKRVKIAVDRINSKYRKLYPNKLNNNVVNSNFINKAAKILVAEKINEFKTPITSGGAILHINNEGFLTKNELKILKDSVNIYTRKMSNNISMVGQKLIDKLNKMGE